MKIRIWTMGKVKQPFILEGEREYLKRFGGGAKVEITELASAKSGKDAKTAKEEEARTLLSRLKSEDFLVVLDEGGRQFSSVGLSQFLTDKMNEGVSPIHFAIGGAFGWDQEIKKRAQFLFSLSELTFPYQLTRLILVEQLYRAHSLIQGLPYHKS